MTRMAKEKLGSKTEGIRLPTVDSQWLDEWQAASAQTRSTVIRAAVRMLRIIVRDLSYEARARFIATLSERDEGDGQDNEFWAAVMAAIAGRKGKKR